MPLVTDAQARAALQKNVVSPVYLLVGDDEVGKAPLLEALMSLVEPDLRAFNLERIYANERPLNEIITSARTLPMLGPRRVVIALRCEAFLKPKRRGASDDEDEDSDAGVDGDGTPVTAELERYLSSPCPETVLVLVAGDAARNTRLYKQLQKQAQIVEFWGLKGARDATGGALEAALRAGERFVLQHLKDSGFRIRPDAIDRVLEHAGTDLGVLRHDLERLMHYCAGKTEISAEDVQAVVGGAVQVDEWALTRAIQAGNSREALRQLRLALEAGQSAYMLLGQLGWLVRAKLAPQAPWRVAAAVDALLQVDVALKSSGGDPQVLLERLVVELCTAGKRPPGRRP